MPASEQPASDGAASLAPPELLDPPELLEETPDPPELLDETPDPELLDPPELLGASDPPPASPLLADVSWLPEQEASSASPARIAQTAAAAHFVDLSGRREPASPVAIAGQYTIRMLPRGARLVAAVHLGSSTDVRVAEATDALVIEVAAGARRETGRRVSRPGHGRAGDDDGEEQRQSEHLFHGHTSPVLPPWREPFLPSAMCAGRRYLGAGPDGDPARTVGPLGVSPGGPGSRVTRISSGGSPAGSVSLTSSERPSLSITTGPRDCQPCGR